MWFSVKNLLLWFLLEASLMCVHMVRKVVTASQYMTGIRVCLHCHIDTGRCKDEEVLSMNKYHCIHSEQDLEQLQAIHLLWCDIIDTRLISRKITYRHDCMALWSVIVWVTVLWICAEGHDGRGLGLRRRPIGRRDPSHDWPVAIYERVPLSGSHCPLYRQNVAIFERAFECEFKQEACLPIYLSPHMRLHMYLFVAIFYRRSSVQSVAVTLLLTSLSRHRQWWG